MLVEYAKSKNVRIWLITRFRDTTDQMDEAFAQFEKWGIAGVKIDIIDRTDQWVMNWYRATAKKAAEHHLMVDFHGAVKPDGSARTYPQCVDARRRHGRGVQPLERASHSQAQRDARLHPHAGGADGLHARRAR